MRLDEKLSLLNNKALPFYKEGEFYVIRNLYLKREGIWGNVILLVKEIKAFGYGDVISRVARFFVCLLEFPATSVYGELF